jgi:hypothetical protein
MVHDTTLFVQHSYGATRRVAELSHLRCLHDDQGAAGQARKTSLAGRLGVGFRRSALRCRGLISPDLPEDSTATSTLWPALMSVGAGH